MTNEPPDEEPTVKLGRLRRRRLARGSIPPGRRWWPHWSAEDTLFTVCVLAVCGLTAIWITYLPECGQ